MAAEFPTSVANFTNPNPVTDDLDTAVGGLTHSGQHGKVNDEIEATQTKIGTGSSTPTSGKVLRATGTGTSNWSQITNADVDAAADIVETKIKKGSASTVLTTSSGNAIAWSTATPAMTDASVARQNLLVNGGFETWQLGTAFTSVADNGLTADQWYFSQGSGSTLDNVNRESSTIKTDSRYSAKLKYTHSSASDFGQDVSGYQLRGKEVTFSCWVYCSAANAARVSLYDGTTRTNGSYHSGTPGWERLSVTATVGNSSTTVRPSVQMNATMTTNPLYLDNATMTVGSYDIAASSSVPYVPLTVGLEAASIGLTRGWTAFTPTLKQSTTISNPTIVYARYLIIGKVAHVAFNLVSTGTGTGGSAIEVTVPSLLSPAYSGLGTGVGAFWFVDYTTGNYAGTAYFTSATALRFICDASTASFGNNPAVTIAVDDQIGGMLTYELA